MGRYVLVCALGVLLAPRLALAGAKDDRAVDYRFSLYPSPAGTPEQGIANLTSAGRLATRGLDELAVQLWDPPAAAAGIGPLTRSVEMVALQIPAAIFGTLLGHELLGHGARARELGFSPSYGFLPPPPYYFPTEGSYGYTQYGDRPLPTTLDEDLVLILGGLEAAELQARQVAFAGFRRDAIRQGDVLLYTGGKLTLLSQLPRDKSDAQRFYHLQALRYGADETALRRELETAVLLSLIDPLLIYGWYATVADFVIRGQRVHRYPAVELSEVARLSGSYRPLLVPWGVEHQLEAMVGGQSGHGAMRVRIGNGVESGSFAVSVAVRDLAVAEHLRLGARVELWSQPPLTLARDLTRSAAGVVGVGALGLPHAAGAAAVVGGSAELVGEFRLRLWSWGMSVGAKSAGHQAGRSLAADAGGATFVGVRF